jgi:hypothetical protein
MRFGSLYFKPPKDFSETLFAKVSDSVVISVGAKAFAEAKSTGYDRVFKAGSNCFRRESEKGVITKPIPIQYAVGWADI